MLRTLAAVGLLGMLGSLAWATDSGTSVSAAEASRIYGAQCYKLGTCPSGTSCDLRCSSSCGQVYRAPLQTSSTGKSIPVVVCTTDSKCTYANLGTASCSGSSGMTAGLE